MKSRNLKICFATSECAPFVKTGGLADVSNSLPAALSKLNHDVKIFLPFYIQVNIENYSIRRLEELGAIPVLIGGETFYFNVWMGKLPGSECDVYFIDCPEFYHRNEIYTNDNDEDSRFILFQHAVFLTLQRLEWTPDVIHCNDWQTGLMPVFLKTHYKWDKMFAKTGCVMSIHNIAYQGRFRKKTIGKANLTYDNFYPEGPYEFFNGFCFLKTGILYSEIITTVSPTYALEIQTPEFGEGLEGVLNNRKDDLYGILNGIDSDVWSPVSDEFISHNYSFDSYQDKIINKAQLLDMIGFEPFTDIPIVGIVSRFASQKGFELLEPVLDEIMNMNVSLVVLGSGEKKYEDFFRNASLRYPGRIFAYPGFNNMLSHLITAGSDIILMPSRYEPCGLNQMYSLNYGTVPVVRKTGGLADTVFDYHEFNMEGNGFSFKDFDPYALYTTLRRALDIFYIKDEWMKIVERGMKADFSWDASAKKYAGLYKKAITARVF